MSHFTVLVIGENPEEQLAPFQENNMGDCPKEFMEFEEAEDQDDEDYPLNEETGKRGYWRNPNSKWDWYQLGGRWTGFFKLKPNSLGFTGTPGLMTGNAEEGYVDQIQKKDIDLIEMRRLAVEKAEKDYDFAVPIFSHLPKSKTWEEFEAEGFATETIRGLFHSQPRQTAWREKQQEMGYDNWPFGFMSSHTDFEIPREKYIQNASDEAIGTFAVVKDGKWYEKGEMGWFAIVHDEKQKDKWNEEFTKLIDSVPDDTLLSVYDCHI